MTIVIVHTGEHGLHDAPFAVIGETWDEGPVVAERDLVRMIRDELVRGGL